MNAEEVIEEAKKILQTEPLADVEAASECLLNLDEQVSPVVTKDLLSRTKIGLIVNKLKKHANADISTRAAMLVEKWKMAIKANPTPSESEEKPVVAERPNRKRRPPNDADNEDEPIGESGKQSQHPEEEPQGAMNPVNENSEYEGVMTKQDKRNRFRSILFKAFIDGFDPAQLHLLEKNHLESLIANIENALWDHHVTKNNQNNEYTAQLRSIKSNLADKKNFEFNSALYMGGIPMERIPVMTSVEMASDAKKQERRKAQKDALEACQSDWDLRNVKRAKGQFPCGKCKSDNTTYVQIQTRSSDEPMTTYVSCLNCGNRWKF